MQEHLEVISAIGLGLGLAQVPGAAAQQNPVTAIDIALEPDTTMVQHAMAANARLLKSFPKGFALGETPTRTSRCCSSLSARMISTRYMPRRRPSLTKRNPSHGRLRRSNITISPLRRSASLGLSSNQRKTCIGCKMR